MIHFTATHKDGVIAFTNQSSEDIGRLETVNDSKIIFYQAEDKYQFNLSKNKIEVLKNTEKIDEFERFKNLGSFQSKNSELSIKGISSWKGGTKIVDRNNNTLVKLNNKSAWIDKGIYEFKIFTEVEPYQLAMMLHLHIQGSKAKTAIVAASIAATVVIVINIFN